MIDSRAVESKMKLANKMASDLERGGPAGLIHLPLIGKIVDRPIRIWSASGQLKRLINREGARSPIDIEYHFAKDAEVGHWTLRNGIDPVGHSEGGANDCLFEVISSQSRWSPRNLRRRTIERMRRNPGLLEKQTELVEWFLKRDRAALMIGGAKYTGRSARDAAYILESSQNVLCDGCRETGHPRGHASHPEASGPNDSVENYSMFGIKSGFLSRSDQDQVAHIALSHSQAQETMRQLNTGLYSLSTTIPIREITLRNFPKMREFFNGRPITDDLNIMSLVLVLRHHFGKRADPEANVFVHTFYPKSR